VSEHQKYYSIVWKTDQCRPGSAKCPVTSALGTNTPNAISTLTATSVGETSSSSPAIDTINVTEQTPGGGQAALPVSLNGYFHGWKVLGRLYRLTSKAPSRESAANSSLRSRLLAESFLQIVRVMPLARTYLVEATKALISTSVNVHNAARSFPCCT
jgi:hypothetical protein